MQTLLTLLHKSEKLAIGLISGTSLDGVDAALVTLENHGLETEIELLHFLTFPYPDGLREKVMDCSSPGSGTVDEICRLNFVLAEVFADAALAVLQAANVAPGDVDFIGSHGQTVHHLPNEHTSFGYPIRSTLQLAEPSVIAKRTGILTVADFRPADMALGGQGAPLVPLFDFIVFRSPQKNRALVNIGGIANLTILKTNGTLEDLLAYDAGPGNMVVDYLMQAFFGRPYDADGKTALQGEVSVLLMDWALEHPYFKLMPPKATGRETFGAAFADRFRRQGEKLKLGAESIITTAAELTARTIWQSYQNDVAPETRLDEFVVSGGGAKNQYIMDRLGKLAGDINVYSIDKLGIPSDAKEAICFAVLANETLSGNPGNVPGATGARAATVLGKICL
ncbi:MAG: anhydro-N-acetylmuramic acid kinase [bacterium]